MKTYSRKKAGEAQDVILDLNELCRLCMAKEDELVPLFDDDDAIPLTLKIMACVALEVFEGDGLPNKICHPCKFQLEKSYVFRKKCESSEMKLRHHLKSLHDKMGTTIGYVELTDNEDNIGSDETMETTAVYAETGEDAAEAENATEQDLVGVTQVAYIQPDPEPEEDPENITLPETQLDDKEACTLKSLKREVADPEEQDNEIVFMDEGSEELGDTSYNAIADAVKATLATQPGFDMSGQLQMKIIPSQGKSTQVEVTTEDGSVIVMELMTEEDAEMPQGAPNPGNFEVNDEGERKIFKCPQCPKSFARRIQLRRHASVHMQQRGFSCGMCEKWFPTRSALVRHERIHTGERPFQCEICQKSFAQKEILYRHMMTHSGTKPYNCTHCNKGFTQREPLRLHLRSHMTDNTHDINLHYCSLCPKVFCHASGLSRHLVTHTGKTFKCRDCDRSFTDKSSLKRHHKQAQHQP